MGDETKDGPQVSAHRHHSLQLGCQCKRCVQMYTLTMQDRDFLRSIGIAWNTRKNGPSIPDIVSDSTKPKI